MDVTPFTAETVPPLGVVVEIAQDFEKPTGQRFTRGEGAVVSEHVLSSDGRVYIGARTPDGRVFRATCREAFAGLPDAPA
jgi:hypothetical protein